MTLSWTAVSGIGQTTYEVRVSGGSIPFISFGWRTPTAAIRNLTNDTRYTFTVVTRDDRGVSLESNEASATPRAPER